MTVLTSSYQLIDSVTAGNYLHRLYAKLNSQDVAANTSLVQYYYTVHRNVSAGSGAFNTSPGATFTATVNGSADSELHTYDFRSYADLTVVSGTRTITHGSDGTKTGVGFTGGGPSPSTSSGFPTATISGGTFDLPRIARGPRVKVAGAWKNSIAYVKVTGVWHIAIPYVKKAGAWVVGGN